MVKEMRDKNMNSAEGVLDKKHVKPCLSAKIEAELAKGYEEMSRINLNLSDSGLAIDNEALTLCEQKLAECE